MSWNTIYKESRERTLNVYFSQPSFITEGGNFTNKAIIIGLNVHTCLLSQTADAVMHVHVCQTEAHQSYPLIVLLLIAKTAVGVSP